MLNALANSRVFQMTPRRTKCCCPEESTKPPTGYSIRPDANCLWCCHLPFAHGQHWPQLHGREKAVKRKNNSSAFSGQDNCLFLSVFNSTSSPATLTLLCTGRSSVLSMFSKNISLTHLSQDSFSPSNHYLKKYDLLIVNSPNSFLYSYIFHSMDAIIPIL